MAARGTRDLDDGEEAITDPEVVSCIRRQSARVLVEATLGAIFLTMAFWLLVP